MLTCAVRCSAYYHVLEFVFLDGGVPKREVSLSERDCKQKRLFWHELAAAARFHHVVLGEIRLSVRVVLALVIIVVLAR